jgi:hypothetical protein
VVKLRRRPRASGSQPVSRLGRALARIAPALATTRSPNAPSLVFFDGLTLMYFTQKAGSTASDDFPVIALAVAPATFTLPPPANP